MSLLALTNLLQGETSTTLVQRSSARPRCRIAFARAHSREPSRRTNRMLMKAMQYPPCPTSMQLTSRRLSGVESPSPRTHLLSNGTYHMMLSSAGGGYSRCQQMDVTRWRSDTTLDAWGQFIYVRDTESREVWSATYQPTCVLPEKYEVIFSIDKVDFHRLQNGIETFLEVAISPEANTEVRQLRITNHSDRPRSIEVTSYAEIALARSGADLAHPAFQKLFLETEYIAEETAILARRRPRDSAQAADWAVHVLAVSTENVTDIQYETSRQAFLGRRRTTRFPTGVRRRNAGRRNRRGARSHLFPALHGSGLTQVHQ